MYSEYTHICLIRQQAVVFTKLAQFSIIIFIISLPSAVIQSNFLKDNIGGEESIPEADMEYMQPIIDHYMCQVSSTCQVLPDSPAQGQPSIKYCLY